MLTDITIGQFFPGQSVLHRMDPRIKLVCVFVFIAAVFVPQNWIGLALSFLYFVVAALLSRLPFRLIIKSIKPILPLILFTAIINIFYAKGNAVLWSWGILTITEKGIITAIFVALRILIVIAGSSLLTYTTSPTALTDGLERLLSPLNKLHLSVHELAMMMSIALRFIPTLVEETDKIMSAQKARGADLDEGGMMKRLKALVPIFVPLIISSFRRAYELATAMECRCYRGGEGRTRMRQLHMVGCDWAALILTLAMLGGLIALNFVLPAVL